MKMWFFFENQYSLLSSRCTISLKHPAVGGKLYYCWDQLATSSGYPKEWYDHFCLIRQCHCVYVMTGIILGYNITVRDSIGRLSLLSSDMESTVISSLQCCSNYTYQVSARTSAGEGIPTEWASFSTRGYYDNGDAWRFWWNSHL